jgi:hypothetical protein
MTLLEKIKAALKGEETNLATAKLADGSGTITNNMDEAFAAGQEIYLQTSGEDGENELVPLADGDHALDDGTTLVVADGKISEIKEASEDPESEELAKIVQGAVEAATKPLLERLDKLEAASEEQEEAMVEMASQIADQPADESAAQVALGRSGGRVRVEQKTAVIGNASRGRGTAGRVEDIIASYTNN